MQFDLVRHLHRQRAFSERTFGPGTRAQGVVDHIRKELREIEAERRAEEADKRGAEGDDEDALISRLARATGKDPVVLRNVFRALPSVA